MKWIKKKLKGIFHTYSATRSWKMLADQMYKERLEEILKELNK